MEPSLATPPKRLLVRFDPPSVDCFVARWDADEYALLGRVRNEKGQTQQEWNKS